MIFSLQKSVLNEALNAVSKAASVKSSISALEGILIKTEQNKIVLSAYDLEIGITCLVDATIIDTGSIILPCRLFLDIIRKLPDNEVKITVNENLIANIECEKTNFTIMGIDPGEFPTLPTVDNNSEIIVGYEEFKRLVKQTIFAVSTNDMKPILTGILFSVEKEKVKAVSLDGFRLAIKKENFKSVVGEIKDFVVPSKALNEILKILPQEENDIEIFVSDKHILFKFENITLISRLLEGEFLNYENAIPKEKEFSLKISKKSLYESIERASLLINATIKSPIKCSFEYDSIKIETATNIGKYSDEILTESFGKELEIGFNPKYMLDAVGACENDEIMLELSGPLNPIVIKPIENDDFLYLVLPVRMKNE